MKLTDIFIRNVNGTGKVQKHTDGGGLFLYVTPEGKKYWRMAYRFGGKQKLLSIGPYPLISLREAREKRDEAKKGLVAGIDPSAAKQDAKYATAEASRNSFGVIAQEWYDKVSTAWVPMHRKVLLSRMNNNLIPYLGKRPIIAITASELLAVLRRIEARGANHVAHRCLGDCGRIFRYAIATGRAERDVAADLRGALAPQNKKHFATITDPKEVGKFLYSLDKKEFNFIIKAALRLALYIFLRAKEITGAEWSEIDFDAAEWRIHAERMKMRQIHIVPLAPQSITILREIHAITGRGRYIFPVQKTGVKFEGRPLGTPSLTQGLRHMGYDHHTITLHGFRAMASTLLNELGYNYDWIERQLAHSERNSIRAAYNYAQYLPERRRMMFEYADYLDGLRQQASNA